MRKLLRQTAIRILVTGFVVALPPLASAQVAPASSSAVIAALEKGQNDDAVRMTGELLSIDPRSYKVWTLRGVGLEHSGQIKEALAAYDHALSLAPDYLPALEGAAQLSYKAQSAKAIPLLRHIVSLHPDNATSHAMLAVLEYRQKNYGLAEQDFAAASEAIRSQPDALMAYAICLFHLDRGAEAIAPFQQVVALEPTNIAARYDLALIQWRCSAASDALATLEPVIVAKNPDSRVLRLAAAIHESNNETPQALTLLHSAILANPDEAANYLEFATLAFAHNSFLVGADIVTRGLTRLPNSAALYMARGVLYGQNGDFEKAMADFERAHKLDPSYSMAATAEGIAQSQRHNHVEALEDFRRQVREHPKDALGYYLLAEAIGWAPADAKQGSVTNSMTEAISADKRAIDLDPHLVQAWDLLASFYLQTGRPEQAVKAARSALVIEPKDQQALYTLILALRKTGSKEELKGLVQTLTDLRKTEATDTGQKARYGQLVEER